MWHERQLHRHNAFITLTYDDDNIPADGSLRPGDLVKFWKRLRKSGAQLRYYAAGEYGGRTHRPHYHACVFGHDWADAQPWKKMKDYELRISAQLNQQWGHGQCIIGDVTFETAAYTSRYVLKTQDQRDYARLDTETGELIPLIRPFARMSLRPAIARTWIERYSADIYSDSANGDAKDQIAVRGRLMRPAKYYDQYMSLVDTARMERIKEQRRSRPHLSRRELAAREKNMKAALAAKAQV